MSKLTRAGTAEPVSRDRILCRERGQGNIHFPSSADHEQDWQLYPVDPLLLLSLANVTTIHTYEYIHIYIQLQWNKDRVSFCHDRWLGGVLEVNKAGHPQGKVKV